MISWQLKHTENEGREGLSDKNETEVEIWWFYGNLQFVPLLKPFLLFQISQFLQKTLNHLDENTSAQQKRVLTLFPSYKPNTDGSFWCPRQKTELQLGLKSLLSCSRWNIFSSIRLKEVFEGYVSYDSGFIIKSTNWSQLLL